MVGVTQATPQTSGNGITQTSPNEYTIANRKRTTFEKTLNSMRNFLHRRLDSLNRLLFKRPSEIVVIHSNEKDFCWLENGYSSSLVAQRKSNNEDNASKPSPTADSENLMQ